MVAFAAFVVVARATNREGTLITGHEELAVYGQSDVVAANLAYLPTSALRRL